MKEIGRSSRTLASSDRGAASVLVIGILGLVVLLAGWLLLLAQAQSARGVAQTAADLGALAGATAVRSAGDGCAVAQETVHRNGAEPESCELLGGGVVRVRSAVPTVLGTASAAARAGPASARG